MEHQKDKPNTLPLVLTSLVDLLRSLKAFLVEGIFRVPGNVPNLTKMRLQIENHNYTFTETDPHVPASVLKVCFVISALLHFFFISLFLSLDVVPHVARPYHSHGLILEMYGGSTQ